MDTEDIFLNPNLFQELHKYNIKKNLDIIEISVYQQKDWKNKIFLPDNHYETHSRSFPKKFPYFFLWYFILTINV